LVTALYSTPEIRKKKKKAGGVFPNLKPDDHHRASVPAPPVKDAAVGRANVTGGRETR